MADQQEQTIKRKIQPDQVQSPTSDEGAESATEQPHQPAIVEPPADPAGRFNWADDVGDNSIGSGSGLKPASRSNKSSRSNSPSSISSPQFDFIVATQYQRCDALCNIKLEVETTDQTIDQINASLDVLTSMWNQFRGDHDALGASCKRGFLKSQYMTEGLYNKAFSAFQKASSMLNSRKTAFHDREIAASMARAQINPDQPMYSTQQLPKIELPEFGGDHTKWRTYRDLFISMVIENRNIRNVERLHYLKMSLKGPAYQLISTVPLSADGFKAAWKIVTDHYNDKESLILCYLDKLFGNKKQITKNPTDIQELISTATEVLDAVKTLCNPEQAWSYLIIHTIAQRLEPKLREEWEVTRASHREPTTHQDLLHFLKSRAKAFQSMAGPKNKSSAQAPASTSRQKSKSPTPSAKTQVSSYHTAYASRPESTKYPCDHCAGSHFIVSCPAFRELSPEDRHKVVTAKRLCFNCFGHHNLTSCASTRTCKTCNRKHHTMIHLPSANRNVQPSTSSSAQPKQETSTPSTSTTTCQAKLITPYSSDQVRILVDPGSEISFVSNTTVTTYGLERQRSSLVINGIGGSTSQSRGSTTMSLQSNYSSDIINIHVHIITNLTCKLPTEPIKPQQWEHLESVQLADPQYFKPRSVDILLGADAYGKIIKPGIKKLSDTSLVAQNTIFGWIILGPTQSQHHPIQKSSLRVQSYYTTPEVSTHEIQSLLTTFWNQEEVHHDTTELLNPEEQACEDHFKATHTRDNNGRYTVRIPLKSSRLLLGESRNTAQRCLQRLQKKLSTSSEYADLYTNFMKEYEDLRHMIRVPEQENQDQQNAIAQSDQELTMTLAHDTSVSGGLRVVGDRSSEQQRIPKPYYLPHHGVLREDKITTKLRVVFNGSSPSASSISVNDIQHTGAKVQKDIADVLMWIRRHKYIFATDITKMYRQINVHPDDWDLQRIMWVDEQQRMVPYQLTTVTYGTRSAPFLAIRSLLQLVADEGHHYPLAIEPLIKGRYVDDIFGGSDHIQDLIDTSDQVTALCKAGGFPLSRWHSNKIELINHINNESITEERSFDDSSAKILGLSWIPHQDVFKFNAKPPCSSSKITKRIILSETAQLYDPLGFLAPFVIQAKALLQDLWLEKLNWDDQVSDQITSKWNTIRNELTQVSSITIPRWIQYTKDSSVELHGFSDASQIAMAAAIYIKVTNPGEEPTVQLICAKSKVAPIKRLSIPRLELTAALILSKLVRYVQNTLELSNIPTFLWTDSQVTLSWIQSHLSKWKDFVRNRVSTIQELTPNSVWRHVPGKDNPADCASRGLNISQLQQHKLWWTGPQWLLETDQHWPVHKNHQSDQPDIEERPCFNFHVALNHPEYHWDMIYRYSTLSKLLRITGLCFRAIQIMRGKPRQAFSSFITPQEIDHSRVHWIISTQAAFFKSELKLIQAAQLPLNHAFNRLTPFVDTQGIMRVGGRLNRAPLELETKHPIILPRHSKLTELIIANAHQQTLHGGTQLTLNHIRQTYWIIGGRAPVRSHIIRCITCARHRGNRAEQLMGQLPAERVTPSRPFAFTGVDYAGPVNIKAWKGRGSKQHKGWLCIFVCFASSALHLEVVSEYSTDSFIAAYRRFTGRRGICNTLFSDCGTNFQGANAELQKLFTKGTKESDHLCCSLANDGTTWKFNPPAAPHMGGKWESAVKSVKHHLNRTIGDTVLTLDELNTLLIQIEAVLNSRPLEPINDDPEDVSALTPAHFLIGESLSTLPEPTLIEINEARLNRWQLIQQRFQHFWKRWSRQYLQQYLSRSKWYHPSNQIKVGSLVLITDERFPPSKWPLARVLRLHPGKDGLTRVVTLKTSTTTLVRPITKLAILPSATQNGPDQQNHQQ